MKKILFSLFTVLALISFSQMTFADVQKNTTYQVQFEPISAGIKPKSMAIHGTDISVINYTDYYVNVYYDNASFALSPRTSGRIISEAIQYPMMRLTDTSNRTFFGSKQVNNYATLSVYVSSGQYVVYETNNP